MGNDVKWSKDPAVDRTFGPKVSVIIPCFNSARTLAASIESALAQSYPNVETIVIDDGSTDDSLQLCAAYGDRIRVVSQPNGGLSAARNTGVRVASGQYITLLDSDDILLPDCIHRRVEILQSDPNTGLVAGWFREIDSDGKPIDRIPELRKVWVEQPFRQAVRRNWGPPVGWTFRKDVIESVGAFDPNLKSCEDWDFVIRVSRHYSIGYDIEPNVLYRKLAGQMSSQHHVMLKSADQVHKKNAALAKSPVQYWIDVRFGRFELGRRTLYQIVFQERKESFRTLLGLVVSHPYMLWVSFFSAISFVFGKRATSKAVVSP